MPGRPRRAHAPVPTGKATDAEKDLAMFVQCRVCKRIRVDGSYRLPWPGELSGETAETYCPRCAKETLALIQSGEFARMAERRAAAKSASAMV